MRNFFIVAMAALSLTACRQNDSLVESDSNFGMQSSSADYSVGCTLPVQTVSGDVGSGAVPTTWTADKIWEIDGIVNVPSGVTLTIEPGTYIKAKAAEPGVASGVLVVQKGGTLNAIGTASAPIVFTSYKLLDCNTSNTPAPGDFGGVVILGNAYVNTGTSANVIEGLTDQSNPQKYWYGSTGTTNNTESSGTLKYVRIEYAGRILPTDDEGNGNEINGLTLGGVGSGTTLENIQVSYGQDDAFEWFGGTVNAKNLIAFAQDDDGFDMDFGYTGTITCALALADINSTHSTSGGNPDSNGIELDGRQSGHTGTTFTQPTINNLTIVGLSAKSAAAVYENGIHVRKGGKLILNDAVVTGYPQGVTIESPTVIADLTFSNVKVHGFNVATASVAGGVYTPITIPGVTATSTSNPAATWGMPQPFFNDDDVDLGSRNCGGFFGSWTKYFF